jgi:hypothetical protein
MPPDLTFAAFSVYLKYGKCKHANESLSCSLFKLL